MKRTRRDKFNIEWMYAKARWDALKNGEPLPPVPNYSVWEAEVDEKGNMKSAEKLVKQVPCDVMKITYDGKVYE